MHVGCRPGVSSIREFTVVVSFVLRLCFAPFRTPKAPFIRACGRPRRTPFWPHVCKNSKKGIGLQLRSSPACTGETAHLRGASILLPLRATSILPLFSSTELGFAALCSKSLSSYRIFLCDLSLSISPEVGSKRQRDLEVNCRTCQRVSSIFE